jgi:hypothetical protein
LKSRIDQARRHARRWQEVVKPADWSAGLKAFIINNLMKTARPPVQARHGGLESEQNQWVNARRFNQRLTTCPPLRWRAHVKGKYQFAVLTIWASSLTQGAIQLANAIDDLNWERADR